MSKYKANDPFKKKDIIPGGGGGYRDVPDSPYIGQPSGTEQYGQGQLGPGWQSSSGMWVDLAGLGTSFPHEIYTDFNSHAGGSNMQDLGYAWNAGEITNMQEFYDWWVEWNDDPDASFMDYYNNLGYGDTFDYMMSHPFGNPSTGSTFGWGFGGIHGTGSGMSPEGGNYYTGDLWGQSGIGGQGDLGTGNVFIGGGMTSGAYGGGMSGQDCASLGPQFNSAGECIACCGEQYAGTGFYGSGEGFNPDTGSVDPDLFGECFEQYQATMGAGYEGSYEEFAGLYC